MMKNVIIVSIVLLGFGVVFNGCEKEEDPCLNPLDIISGIIEADYNFGACFSTVGALDHQYVINSQAEFDELAIIPDNTQGCNDVTPTSIDFTRFTLLGLYADGSCEVIFNRNVEVDSENKTYLYKVVTTECGSCEKLEYSMNWVLVQKLPNDHTVQFLVE